ncbi:DYW domain [Arabidopsis suecica]|uniref:DYW domain n=1 Tax=Arabidopsis suecica TaxID=45249 RepID=A0A8T2CGN2_ARASU|nr:DYW domain [Arabidopsis suecica]
MVRLWCGKLKLSKPYLALATRSRSRWFSSRGAPSHHHHSLTYYGRTEKINRLERYITERTWTQNPIVCQYKTTVSPSAAQNVTIETFDSLCNQGNWREAVEVLDYLENKGFAMDLIRLLRLAKICGEPEALEAARVVHDCIIALVSPCDVGSRNAIIKMYSCCGSVDDALKVFDEMPKRNSETWCVMMRCFVNNGFGEEAINLFTRFKEEGNKPDGEIFNQVLFTCTLTGDVSEGSLQFEAMSRDYGIRPSMEHYHSVTKMFATSGHLDEALNFVERMPMEPSVDVWETLMNLSRVHGDVELGDRCAELVEKLDATRLDKVSSAGLVVTKASDNVKKEPSNRSEPYWCYNFRPVDTSHPQMNIIYETLMSLRSQMKEMGYVPDTRFYRTLIMVMENKEQVFGYREEIAVVESLLKSKPRSSITLITNVRIVGDCHNMMKLMSVITGRELIKRDSKRYHYFKNGICNCNDRW